MSPLGIKAALAGGALLAAAFGGWTARDKLCDAAEARARVAHLERQLGARAAAEAINADLFAEQQRELADIKERADAMRSQISDGVCLDAGDVDRLRRLWTGP